MKPHHIKENFISLGIIAASIVIALVLQATIATAQESQITFPVKELGNCTDKESCKAYCDKSEHGSVCLSFARKNKLMSEAEIQLAERVLKEGGPGGCLSKETCEAYCDDIANIDQCVSFAEKNNLIPQDELEEARKIQAAVRRGVKLPPCKNKKDCDAFCSEPNNMEMCMNFALEAGFMSEDEKQDAQKMLQALKKGVKPPPCRGKKECDEFCSQEGNLEQCVAFAEAAGFMSAEDAARTRKTGGRGPGGCRGAECQTFCDKPENQQICFDYSVENGQIKQEELDRMRQGGDKMIEALRQAPPEVASCVKAKMGDQEFEKARSGKYSRQSGDPFRVCFDEYMSSKGAMPPPDGQRPREYPSPYMTPPTGENSAPPAEAPPHYSPSPEPAFAPSPEPSSAPSPAPESAPAEAPAEAPTTEAPREAPTTESPQSLLRMLGNETSLANIFEAVRILMGK